MVLVSVLLLVAFRVQSMTLTTPVLAESAVGVEVGDWAKYDLAAAIEYDPNAELPPDLIETMQAINNTEWIKNVVVTISGTKITFERVVHYRDGNETKSVEYVDVDTGKSSPDGSLMFIPSNIGKNGLVHASLTEHYSINETIRRTYVGATRDINHLNVSTTFYGELITASYYWDKVTGIFCERLGMHVTFDGTYTITFAISEKIMDTNIWVGKPDTQPPIAEAGQDQTVIKGTSVTFDASGCSDNIGITSYEWDFGDGNTGTGLIATHTYAKSGSYVVMLTVWDAAGNSNSDEITVNVEEALLPPIIGVSVLVVCVLLGLFVWRWKKRRRKR